MKGKFTETFLKQHKFKSKMEMTKKVSNRQHCHGIVAFEVKKKVMQIPCTVEIGASEASMSQKDETAHHDKKRAVYFGHECIQ